MLPTLLALSACVGPTDSGGDGQPVDAGGGSTTTPSGGGGSGTLTVPDVDLDRLPQLRAAALRDVRDWAYQLQGTPALDLAPLARSAFDLFVIDYSADGSAAGEFTPQQIQSLRESGPRPRIVLAYMSIGEAEVGRFYWNDAWVTPNPGRDPDGPFTLTAAAPDFLVEPNPDFPDNFKVRYWLDSWRRIIVENPGGDPLIGDADSYLDRIIAAGFDGVYLDIIDAFEFFGLEGTGERPQAASEMIDFVAAITRHARTVRGRTSFLVVPQNGAGIIAAAAFPAATVPAGVSATDFAAQRRADYFAAIDGIGAEDTFYFGDADENNPLDPQAAAIALLDGFRAAGLAVLAIDYVTRNELIDDFYGRAKARGWLPYASIRDLSTLTVNPTQPPVD
ncbi:MAG: endo alpha-1,4 polygalactosaminidase [Phycisphaerae bacterium]